MVLIHTGQPQLKYPEAATRGFFVEIGSLKNFAELTEKDLCRSLFSIK